MITFLAVVGAACLIVSAALVLLAVVHSLRRTLAMRRFRRDFDRGVL